jgi:predicted CopG family antitoxin
MKSIQIDRDIYNYLVANGLGGAETASAIIRRKLSHTIEIDDDLYEELLRLAENIGESASSILRRELGIQDGPVEPPQPAPTRIEFRMRAGTGSSAWNNQAETVVGVVGQTLRVYNDDTVPHRLHTNGVPFPHAATDIAPNSFQDFMLQAPSPAANLIYDHNFGQNARFWLEVKPAP